MKKALSLFLVFAMLCSLLTFATVTTSAAGTVEIESTATTVDIGGVTYTVIRDRAGLEAIGTDATTMAGKYILANDIDLGNTGYVSIGGGGGSATPFSGVLDGNGHTISNFNATIENDQTWLKPGLFKKTQNATIKNLTIAGEMVISHSDNPDTTGETEAIEGGVFVCNDSKGGSTFENLTNMVNVTITDNAPINYGMICGMTSNSTFTNCVNMGTLDYTSSNAGKDCMLGGIAGNASNDVTFTNCANLGQLMAKGSYVHFGGILGRTAWSTSATFVNCLNAGDLTYKGNGNFYSSSRVGGMLGNSWKCDTVKITGCVNTGDISCGVGESGGCAGGIMAYIHTDDGTNTYTIEYCANTGDVKAGWDDGGILGQVGNINKAQSRVNYCFNTGDCNMGAIIGNVKGLYDGTDGTVKVNWDYNYSTVEGLAIFRKYRTGSGSSAVETTPTDAVGSKVLDSSDDLAEIVSILNGSRGIDSFRLCGEDTIVPVVRATSSYTPAKLAVQDNAATRGEEPLTVRLLSVISGQATDYTALGFLVTTKENGADYKTNLDCDCNYLYTEVKGGGESYAATLYGGDYIYAYTFSNVPTSGTATFVVTPYTVAGGICYEGATYTVDYTNGTLAE